MRIYLYEAVRDPQIKAFTNDATGGNLPDEQGPWRRSGSGSALVTGDPSGGAVAAIVERDGYWIPSPTPAAQPMIKRATLSLPRLGGWLQ